MISPSHLESFRAVPSFLIPLGLGGDSGVGGGPTGVGGGGPPGLGGGVIDPADLGGRVPDTAAIFR